MRVTESAVPAHELRQVRLIQSAANAAKNAANPLGANAARMAALGKSPSGLFPFAGVADRILRRAVVGRALWRAGRLKGSL